MKIAIIGDTHFGVRNDSQYFIRKQKEYFTNHFFPYLEENNIDTIIHLGDLFDKRKQINYTSLAHTQDTFITPVIEKGLKLHLLVGNHDSYYKSSGELVNPRLLFGYAPKDQLIIYDKPVIKQFGSKLFHIVPWIYPFQKQEVVDAIKLSPADICVGHFEMAGVVFQGSTVSRKGIDTDIFTGFKHVFSGHYHKPSEFYVGCPYQMRWSDYDDKKRIIVYDTETDEKTDIHFDVDIYKKYVYKGQTTFEDNEDVHDKIVRIIVKSKDDPSAFERWVSLIEEQEPESIDIKEEYLYVDIIADEEEGREKSTLSILMDSIDDIRDLKDGDKVVVKEIMKQLYEKALK